MTQKPTTKSSAFFVKLVLVKSVLVTLLSQPNDNSARQQRNWENYMLKITDKNKRN